MSLKKYREKRHFDQTTEPRGEKGIAQNSLRFVVQMHQSRRLHFDFRLELDGVLKSWAVPKGPSLNPEDRRLAVMVEDHPLEYRNFEGIIPKGNYGAGTVMVWDEGSYHSRQTSNLKDSERLLREGLEQGHITFILLGRKLKGEFALVKLKKSEEDNWLLLKKRDEFASPADILANDRSVLTNRTIEEIQQNAVASGEVWHPGQGATHLDLTDAPISPWPQKIKPMLATPVEKAFDREGWWFELKWDGYRAIAEVRPEGVRLYSRNLLSLGEQFAPIVSSLRKIPHVVILDGEIVVTDGAGNPSFQLLQEFQKSGKGQLVYYVFDLLYLDGHDLRKLALERRKSLLKQVLPSLPNILYGDHVETQGAKLFELISQKGLEGVIAKDSRSPYLAGRRSLYWLKIKTHHDLDAVIGGFTEGRGGRTHFGALLLGVYQGNRLIYIGHVGSGFGGKQLAGIKAKLVPLIQPKSPFKIIPKTNTRAQWVQPSLVCEVSFQEWTKEGILRQPVFLRLREDKTANSVRLEPSLDLRDDRRSISNIGKDDNGKTGGRPPSAQTLSESQRILVGEHEIRLTHLDKLYFPADKITKRELIQFYREVALVLVPHLKDRPQSLHRHPNGIDGQSFFQKDVEQPPSWVKTVRIHSESGRKEIQYMLCQDEASLLYMVNLGCIELNPWSSRLGTLDKPDYIVLDLDPVDTSFDQVIETAQATRKILENIEVEAHCKTSGQRGIHICLPLGARYNYEQARQFAEILAHLVHQSLPKSTSLVRDPNKRRNKVYIDFLQNRQGQTIAAPYSVRPLPEAPISTPLKWQEVKSGLDPRQFTIKTILKRLDRIGDLWQPTLGPGIDIMKALQLISKDDLLKK